MSFDKFILDLFIIYLTMKAGVKIAAYILLIPDMNNRIIVKFFLQKCDSLKLENNNINAKIPKYSLECIVVIQTSGVIGGENKITKIAKILCQNFVKRIESLK